MTPIDAYDYDLPQRLIAQEPLANRVDARMMIVDRGRQTIEHRYVRDLPEFIAAGDALVLNDTKVTPARLVGFRALTGGNWEGLFLSANDRGHWRLLGKTRGKIDLGEVVNLVDDAGREQFRLRLIAREEGGVWLARPEPLSAAQNSSDPVDTWSLLERVGRVPLPPYIHHGEALPVDKTRYQTVYANEPGSVAAPTAGLHFTPELLGRVAEGGASIAKVTLHVGLGTFRPVAVNTLEEHLMHAEWARLDAATAGLLNQTRAAGKRVIAVGTTSVRTLETVADRTGGALTAWQGETNLFIRPPFMFRAVDALLTNFHLPKSTLLVLVCTFGGDELLRKAYDAAVREEYRFFSYGDCMLIV